MSRDTQGNYYANLLRSIEILGGKCVCCGETDPMRLQLDHINGGGCGERKRGLTHHKLPRAIANGLYPNVAEHIQLLCGSCHVAKSRNYGKLYDGTQPSRMILSQQNRTPKGIITRMSRYKNVYFDQRCGMWSAKIMKNGVTHCFGSYATEDQAAAAVAKFRSRR